MVQYCIFVLIKNLFKMKIIIALVFVLFSLTLSAQNFSGQAFYQTKTTVDMDGFGGGNMTEDMKKMIAERMKKYLEKTYILTFNKTESIYREDEVLETNASGSGRMGMMMGSFTAGDQYKNLEENLMLEEREFFGKQFLVKDTLLGLDWKLEKETKQIGQYIAFKATAVKKIDENDFSMARRRSNNDDEKEEAEKENDSTKSKDLMDEIEIPTEVIVTAWYTPQIPVGHGPGEYSGLDGLILELNFHRTTILCSKIIMNPKEVDKITAPTKGKEVTREEYTAIVKQKVDEMREMYRGGGRRGDGRIRH